RYDDVTRVGPHGAFRFYRASGLGSSARLADVVGSPPFRIDARSIAGSALLLPRPLTETPYRGVSATWQVASEAVGQEPTLRAPNAPEEAAVLLRTALTNAVDRSLSDVRRVAVMTGGLDSSTLLALAVEWAKRTGGSAFGVTLDFEGPCSDRPYVRALEQQM